MDRHRTTASRHSRTFVVESPYSSIRRIADRMADRVAERREHMTPDERERFQQRIRERCPSTSGSTGQ
jgi:flagellar motor switch protein FliM